ncbi:MAG: aspartate--tRNA(Asn) ligase [Candidatus Pacearchaeota archaeon]
MERSYIEDVFKKKEGEKILVKGWVYDKRDLKKVRFIVLRDITGRVQIVGIEKETDKEIFSLMDKINRETVIEVEGIIKDSKQAPGGKEINPTSLKILAEAENSLPIDVSDYSKTDLPIRLDNRFLDFHREKIQAIFKIQTEICHAFREFFYQKKFIEIQPPYIISAASEGGTELFPVQYFEKKAYLAQSPQLYKQMLACSMEKTFSIGPAWRAEKHNTTRHINEIRMIDVEAAFHDQFSIMKLLEESVQYVVENVLKNCKKELDILGVRNIKVPKGVYLHYEEAIKKVGGKVGEDFSPEQEKKLCDMYQGDIVFTHSWPTKIKPFYIMPKDENPDSKESCGFDALYLGVEISSGGQRIHIPKILEKMIKKKGLNPKNFESYINSFRYGAPPHAGWAIGIERLTQIICGLDNIKEATMFPRDRDRLIP